MSTPTPERWTLPPGGCEGKAADCWTGTGDGKQIRALRAGGAQDTGGEAGKRTLTTPKGSERGQQAGRAQLAG
jgi:hypothetical protein